MSSPETYYVVEGKWLTNNPYFVGRYEYLTEARKGHAQCPQGRGG